MAATDQHVVVRSGRPVVMDIRCQRVMAVVDLEAMSDACRRERAGNQLRVADHSFDGLGIRDDARLAKIAAKMLEREVLARPDPDGVATNVDLQPGRTQDFGHPRLGGPGGEFAGKGSEVVVHRPEVACRHREWR